MTETQETWTADEVAALPVHTEVHKIGGGVHAVRVSDQDNTPWMTTYGWSSHKGVASYLSQRPGRSVRQPDELVSVEVLDEEAEALEAATRAADLVLGIHDDTLCRSYSQEPIDLDALTIGEARRHRQALARGEGWLENRAQRIRDAQARLSNW